MNIGRGLYNMFTIGLTAIFWIAVLKLLTAKYRIPGFSEVVAIV